MTSESHDLSTRRTLDRQLVEFADTLRWDDLTTEVVDRLKLQILDVLACLIAGRDASGVAGVRDLVLDWGGAGLASVIGSDKKVPAHGAALVNATAARALELDDVHEKALLHPGVAAVPLGLAVAQEAGPTSGIDLLTALAAGEEVMCRLGLAPEYHVAGPQHTPRGWSFTYQCGLLGGTLTAGKLLKLDGDGLSNAMGIAYTSLSGNQQAVQEGVLAIRVQQGLTAQAAITSAFLAQRGITGPEHWLTGTFGWLTYWHGNGYDTEALTGDLGERWELLGTSIKIFPTCRITHNAITGVIEGVSQSGCRLEDISKIVVHVNSRESWDEVVQPIEERRAPRNGIEAQFSLPFVCAIAAVRGTINLAHMSDEGVRDKATREFANKIVPVFDPEADVSKGRILPMPVRVEVHDANGLRADLTVDYPLGHPERPLNWDDLTRKLFELGETAEASEEKLATIVSMVEDLQEMTDVSALTELVATI